MPTVALVLVLIVGFIILKVIGVDYFQTWLRNPALIIFVLVALLSLSWSVYFDASLYKIILFVFATVAGSYIAVAYDLKGVIKVVTWAAVVSIVLSILILIFIPNGIMQNVPYVGSWRLLFWHRNHTGDLMAYFNALFLFRVLSPAVKPLRVKIFDVAFYLLSLVLVFGARSATGIVVFGVLHFILLVGFAWLKWRHLLKPIHYYLFAAFLLIMGIVFFLNVGFFFGLLGRSANLTGRTPLWRDLIFNFWTQKPWLGYGYGALWMQRDFRYLMMERQGWSLFPVFFSDNGFIDILLNLGLAGFIPFAAMFFSCGYGSFRHAISSKNWEVFFLPLTLMYVLVGNLSYSFLLEVDQFVWILLIITVFATTRLSQGQNRTA